MRCSSGQWPLTKIIKTEKTDQRKQSNQFQLRSLPGRHPFLAPGKLKTLGFDDTTVQKLQWLPLRKNIESSGHQPILWRSCLFADEVVHKMKHGGRCNATAICGVLAKLKRAQNFEEQRSWMCSFLAPMTLFLLYQYSKPNLLLSMIPWNFSVGKLLSRKGKDSWSGLPYHMRVVMFDVSVLDRIQLNWEISYWGINSIYDLKIDRKMVSGSSEASLALSCLKVITRIFH